MDEDKPLKNPLFEWRYRLTPVLASGRELDLFEPWVSYKLDAKIRAENILMKNQEVQYVQVTNLLNSKYSFKVERNEKHTDNNLESRKD